MEITAPKMSSALRKKWSDLISASHDGFAVPIQVIPLSKLTPSKRKSLILQFRSELEQIRLMQKKMVSQRVKAASLTESGGNIINNGSTRKDPPGGIMNKSFPLNSGPGQKSGATGRNPGVTGTFKSGRNTLGINLATATLLRQCDDLLKKLMIHQFGWVFNKPVDIVALQLTDYFDVIKHPMDLGTIKKKIATDKYSSPLEFVADVRLTFSNAMTYNPPGSDVYIMADTLSKVFETRWKPVQKKIDATYTDSICQSSILHDEIDIVDPMAPCKKRKLSTPLKEVDHKKLLPKQYEVVPEPIKRKMTDEEPIKRKMTDEEKHTLSKDLESCVDDLTENIIDFLKKQSSNGGEVGDEEIEIDIDALSDDALFTLRGLLDEVFQGKQVNTTKAETFEMELPNESGLSNSSMQLGKENDYAYEDIHIGGNVHAGSSDPAVQMEKGSTLLSNQLCKPESIDDMDSSSSSDSESECPKAAMLTVTAKDSLVSDDDGSKEDYTENPNGEVTVDENNDGSPTETQTSHEKRYRAAILKDRFRDTIIKAQEMTLLQGGDKVDPEKLRRERGELEMLKRKEKARLQAEAKAAEAALKRIEAKSAAEAKRMRELEREAARQALMKIEKTVEINENSRFLEDLEMLSAALPSEHHPSSVGETSPEDSQDGLGSFKFGGSNPLEQLGLYMKVDDEDEEPDVINGPDVANDVEEGEID